MFKVVAKREGDLFDGVDGNGHAWSVVRVRFPGPVRLDTANFVVDQEGEGRLKLDGADGTVVVVPRRGTVDVLFALKRGEGGTPAAAQVTTAWVVERWPWWAFWRTRRLVVPARWVV